MDLFLLLHSLMTDWMICWLNKKVLKLIIYSHWSIFYLLFTCKLQSKHGNYQKAAQLQFPRTKESIRSAAFALDFPWNLVSPHWTSMLWIVGLKSYWKMVALVFCFSAFFLLYSSAISQTFRKVLLAAGMHNGCSWSFKGLVNPALSSSHKSPIAWT